MDGLFADQKLGDDGIFDGQWFSVTVKADPWVNVAAVATVWSDLSAYVDADYVDEDYVIGIAASGPWINIDRASNTWVDV